MILINGNAGDYVASRMFAGTVGIFSQVGQYAGFGMKRGTLLLRHQPKILVTWQDCGAHNLPFMHILLQSFKGLPSKFASLSLSRVHKFAGDLSVDGRAEMLIID